MVNREIKPSDEQRAKAVDENLLLHEEGIGEHLSDDDFIKYAMELTPDEESQRILDHISACTACTCEVKDLIGETEAWRGEQGEARLNAYRESLLSSDTRRSSFDQQVVTLWGQAGRLIESLTIPNPFRWVTQ